MATKNIIGPEREENQQPPATPTCRVLNQLFAAAVGTLYRYSQSIPTTGY